MSYCCPSCHKFLNSIYCTDCRHPTKHMADGADRWTPNQESRTAAKRTPPVGWTCPKCATAWSPEVRKCDC